MFDWNDYLKIANDFLMVDPNSAEAEAYYRCGISRAYYSAFNNAVDFLDVNQTVVTPINGEGSHQALIRTLKQKKPYASKNLGMLKNYRKQSDYQKIPKITESTFKISLNLAILINREL